MPKVEVIHKFNDVQKEFLLSKGYHVRQFSNGQTAEKSFPILRSNGKLDDVQVSIYCMEDGIRASASTPNGFLNPETLQKVCDASQIFIQDVDKVKTM